MGAAAEIMAPALHVPPNHHDHIMSCTKEHLTQTKHLSLINCTHKWTVFLCLS